MADWPLTSDLGPLGALPTVSSLARGFVGVTLNGWGLDALTDVAELLVSELTTNVARAATNPDGTLRYDDDGKLPLLWIRLLFDHERLMLEVWDTLPAAFGAPVTRHPEPDEESGRGLEIIENRADSLNRFLQAYRQLLGLPAPVLKPVSIAERWLHST